MRKTILNTHNKTLTFTFWGEEFVVDVTGMEYDHWDTIHHNGLNTQYDINLYFDEFKTIGVGSFQLTVYELYENGEVFEIGDSVDSFEVISLNEEGVEIGGDDLELAMFGSVPDINNVDYIKQHYYNMKLVIDNESVNIYINNGEHKDPTQICYWHLDEVEEDSSVAISIANAINLFHTDKLKLIETLFGKVK